LRELASGGGSTTSGIASDSEVHRLLLQTWIIGGGITAKWLLKIPYKTEHVGDV
jgi:hypothetical protein